MGESPRTNEFVYIGCAVSTERSQNVTSFSWWFSMALCCTTGPAYIAEPSHVAESAQKLR